MYDCASQTEDNFLFFLDINNLKVQEGREEGGMNKDEKQIPPPVVCQCVQVG